MVQGVGRQGELSPEGWMEKHTFYQVRREKRHFTERAARGRAEKQGECGVAGRLHPSLCVWSREVAGAKPHRILQSGVGLRKAPVGSRWFRKYGSGPEILCR